MINDTGLYISSIPTQNVLDINSFDPNINSITPNMHTFQYVTQSSITVNLTNINETSPKTLSVQTPVLIPVPSEINYIPFIFTNIEGNTLSGYNYASGYNGSNVNFINAWTEINPVNSTTPQVSAYLSYDSNGTTTGTVIFSVYFFSNTIL